MRTVDAKQPNDVLVREACERVNRVGGLVVNTRTSNQVFKPAVLVSIFQITL
jgi:hypothetical protein